MEREARRFQPTSKALVLFVLVEQTTTYPYSTAQNYTLTFRSHKSLVHAMNRHKHDIPLRSLGKIRALAFHLWERFQLTANSFFYPNSVGSVSGRALLRLGDFDSGLRSRRAVDHGYRRASSCSCGSATLDHAG